MSPGAVSLRPPADPALRCAGRLLAMVHELHKAGYQRLRISPGLAPSGCHWRCLLLPAGLMAADGWSPRPGSQEVETLRYSTGQGNRYFDWPDTAQDGARELAAKLLQRCPRLAAASAGHDWAYAGWYTWMLGRAENGTLPVFYADFELALDPALQPPPP